MIHSVFLSLYVTLIIWVAHSLTSSRALIVAISSGIVIFLYERYLTIRRREQVWAEMTKDLPPALVVGASFSSELSSRISGLWVDQEQMSMILSEIREGVLAIDSNRHIILANDRALAILNSPQSVKDTPVEDLALPTEVAEAMERSLKGEAFESTWKVGEKPNRRYYEVVGLPIPSKGALLVFRDITKIRRLERVRRDFIANISHELRTPITIVRANAETLINGAVNDPEFGPRFLSAILRNGERLSHLINDLLDLSRIEAGQYALNIRRCSTLPIIQRVIDTLTESSKARDQEILLDIEHGSWAVFDEQAFEHIVTNYVANAIKYTPTGAQITVRIIERKTSVLLEVEDDGPGIAAKHRPRLFERFYRVDKGRSRDEGGTGLGLSIVRHLAEAMGAEVGMRTVLDGNGSIFWCQISKEQVTSIQHSDLA